MSNLVTYDELSEVTGYKSPSKVKACLMESGVRVLTGRDGKPFTTREAINAALGVSAGTKERAAVEFD